MPPEIETKEPNPELAEINRKLERLRANDAKKTKQLSTVVKLLTEVSLAQQQTAAKLGELTKQRTPSEEKEFLSRTQTGAQRQVATESPSQEAACLDITVQFSNTKLIINAVETATPTEEVILIALNDKKLHVEAFTRTMFSFELPKDSILPAVILLSRLPGYDPEDIQGFKTKLKEKIGREDKDREKQGSNIRIEILKDSNSRENSPTTSPSAGYQVRPDVSPPRADLLGTAPLTDASRDASPQRKSMTFVEMVRPGTPPPTKATTPPSPIKPRSLSLLLRPANSLAEGERPNSNTSAEGSSEVPTAPSPGQPVRSVDSNVDRST